MKNLRNTHPAVQVKNALIALFLSQSLTLLSLPVLADTAYVKIAGQPIFPISSAADAGTVAKRAETIQEYLDNALVAAKDRSPNSVNITYVKGTPVITLGGYQVVTVDTHDASAANTTPALLANQWADKIRAALSNQASVNSYVAQLTGSYASSAPPVNSVNTARPEISQPQSNFVPYSGNQVTSGANNYPPAPNNYPQQQNNYSARPSNNFPPQNQPFNGSPQQGYDSYHANSYNPNTNYSPGYQSNFGQNPNQVYYQGGPNNQPQGYRQGRIAYAQVGQIIPVTLSTSIATQVAKSGDLIQATVSQNVNVGDSVIPAGSVVIGQVTDARAGGRLTRSGELQIRFNRLRLPDGSETPITAHIVGSIAKYAEVGGDQSDTFKGETTKNKVGSVAFRGLLGAGGGAALGTAVGAIAGGGHGAGMGAWSGAAIGGGLGAADSLILRKGKDVTIPSGTNMQLQLDSPVAISGVAPAGY